MATMTVLQLFVHFTTTCASPERQSGGTHGLVCNRRRTNSHSGSCSQLTQLWQRWIRSGEKSINKIGGLLAERLQNRLGELCGTGKEFSSWQVHFHLSALDAYEESGPNRLQGLSSIESELLSLCRQGKLDKAVDSLSLVDPLVPSVELYRTLLDKCTRIKSVAQAKRVQVHLAGHGLESGFLGECLVNTFVKCGSLEDAFHVFHRLPHRTVVSWNAIIAGCTRAGRCKEALKMYQQMREQGVKPNQYTFGSLLRSCGRLSDFEAGKYIHAEALKFRCGANMVVATSLVDMYSKCGRVSDAQSVFRALPARDKVAWTTMLSAYVQHGLAEMAMELYIELQEVGVIPDAWIFVSALQTCGILAERDVLMKPISLHKGKAIHAAAWRQGHAFDDYICSSLISMYEKSGSIMDAQTVFDGLVQPNVVVCNAMLTALAQHSQGEEALKLYRRMLETDVHPNDRTFVTVLQVCGMLADNDRDPLLDGQSCKMEYLHMGKVLHAEAWRTCHVSDVYVGHALISMYGRCGSVIDARRMFVTLSQQDVVSCTALLAVYTQHGQAENALELYGQILEDGFSPDDRSFVSSLQACGMLAEEEEDTLVEGKSMKVQALAKGKVMHAALRRRGFEHNVFLGSSLVSMYGKCGSIIDARDVFERLVLRDAAAWNAILAAYSQQGEAERALEIYGQMMEEGASPDNRSFLGVLQACGVLADKEESIIFDGRSVKLKALEMGKATHADCWKRGYKIDAFVCSTLVSIYGKCGSTVDAEIVFYGFSERDLVMWNAMLAVYAQQGEAETAWQLFLQMQREFVSPDEVTFVCILQACGSAGNFKVCRQIQHALTSRKDCVTPVVASSLIHAYGRCSRIVEAQEVFDELVEPDMVSWNALIAAYARQGDCERSLQLFEKMLLAGIQPDGVTFLSVLSACSHAGHVDKGIEYFVSMSRDHGITPDVLHYSSLVDLLGRLGHFEMVKDLLATMPVQPSLSMSLCLLNACRKHGNVVLGKHAFDCAVLLHPQHASAYVLMSNIYTNAGMWDCEMKVAELRREAGACRMIGKSWIEHEETVHGFIAGDHKHQQHGQIYNFLRLICS